MLTRAILMSLAVGAAFAADPQLAMPAAAVPAEPTAALPAVAAPPAAQPLAEAAPAPAPAAVLAEPVMEPVATQPLAAAAPAPAPGVQALGGKIVYAAPVLAAAPISGARPAPFTTFPQKKLVVEPKQIQIPKIRLVKTSGVPVSGARPLAPPQVVRIAPKELPNKEVPNYVKPGRFSPEVVIGEKVLPAVPLVVAPELKTFTLLRPVATSGAPVAVSGAPISGSRKMGKKAKKGMPAPPAPVSGVGPYAAYEKLG